MFSLFSKFNDIFSMNNLIHNTWSAQSFFFFFFFYRHAEPIPAPFTFKFQSFTTLWMNGWMEGERETGTNERTNDWMNEWMNLSSLSSSGPLQIGLKWKKWLAMPMILNMLNWAKWKPFTRNGKDYLWGQNSEIVYAQTRISSVYERLCRDTAQHTILDKAQSTTKHNSSYLPEWIVTYFALNPRAVREPSVTKRTINVWW